MMYKIITTLLLLSLTFTQSLSAQSRMSEMNFTVAMKEPSSHEYGVQFECKGVKREWVDVKMPVWMPGYYQVLNYADNVSAFHVVNKGGDTVRWERLITIPGAYTPKMQPASPSVIR